MKYLENSRSCAATAAAGAGVTQTEIMIKTDTTDLTLSLSNTTTNMVTTNIMFLSFIIIYLQFREDLTLHSIYITIVFKLNFKGLSTFPLKCPWYPTIDKLFALYAHLKPPLTLTYLWSDLSIEHWRKFFTLLLNV